MLLYSYPTCPRGIHLPLLFYLRGRGYKKNNRVGYNMISIMTLSLLAYFTHIFIDIIIYALGSTPWSFGNFWMVGRVIKDPSLSLLSPCEVVTWVLIFISRKETQELLIKYPPIQLERRSFEP
jgi:hypothetical protein